MLVVMHTFAKTCILTRMCVVIKPYRNVLRLFSAFIHDIVWYTGDTLQKSRDIFPSLFIFLIFLAVCLTARHDNAILLKCVDVSVVNRFYADRNMFRSNFGKVQTNTLEAVEYKYSMLIKLNIVLLMLFACKLASESSLDWHSLFFWDFVWSIYFFCILNVLKFILFWSCYVVVTLEFLWWWYKLTRLG